MREMAMNQAASDLVRISPNGTKVRTIPATVQRFAPSVPLRARLRVAAYAREKLSPSSESDTTRSRRTSLIMPPLIRIKF